MGIFAEDLINFGNLMEATIDFTLSKEDLKGIVNTDVEFEPHMISVVIPKKVLVFTKPHKIKLKEAKYIKNEKHNRFIGFDMLLENEISMLPSTFQIIENKPYLDFWPHIKLSSLYPKVPNQFRDRIIVKDYIVKSDGLVLKLGVRK